MKLIHWLDDNFEKYICVTIFMVFTAFMAINVVMRYVFKSAIPWASDLVVSVCMVCMVCYQLRL